MRWKDMYRIITKPDGDYHNTYHVVRVIDDVELPTVFANYRAAKQRAKNLFKKKVKASEKVLLEQQ
jgi:hypothetical protein